MSVHKAESLGEVFEMVSGVISGYSGTKDGSYKAEVGSFDGCFGIITFQRDGGDVNVYLMEATEHAAGLAVEMWNAEVQRAIDGDYLGAESDIVDNWAYGLPIKARTSFWG